MASNHLGFKLSGVLDIDIIPAEKAILFTTKHLIYELVFDDEKKAEDLIAMIRSFRDRPAEVKQEKTRPKFYLENNKEEGYDENEKRNEEP